MPTCLASSPGLLRAAAHSPIPSSSTCTRAVVVRTTLPSARRTAARPVIARHASSASAVPPKVEAQRTHVLTALHKTTSLLPRILSSAPPGRDGTALRESLPFWEDVLGRVYEDLTLTPEKREKDAVRVVVYGVDPASGANELVSALLEDPFASDEQKQALRTRWESQPEGSRRITLRYGSASPAEGDEDTAYLQSSWLQQFGMPVEVIELKPSSASSDASSAKDLFTADVPIILCNPTTTAPSSLPAGMSSLPLTRENAILAILSPSPLHPATAEHGLQAIASSVRGTLNVVFVDPQRALDGLETLASGSASPMSVQRYQDNVSGSNISGVTRAVAHVLSSPTAAAPMASARVLAAHTETGRALIADVLAACREVLARASADADAVQDRTSALREQMEEAKAKVHLEVFGDPEEKGGDEIAKAVAHAKAGVKDTMDALVWYKLFWRVDDVREVVAAAVDRAWCRDLERKLVFHAGRLASLQSSLTASAHALAHAYPPSSPYHSPVLHNALARLTSAPSFPLSPTALTAPLHARQAQLAHPTARLHAAAQRAVLGMSGSALGGAALAWAGWAHELHLLPALPLPFLGDGAGGAETALAAGLFGAAAGVRWAVGRWDAAKRRWWRDWDRVGEGLERDLKLVLARTMDERIVVVGEAACTGLDELATRRRAEVADLKDEAEALNADIRSVKYP